MRTPIRLPRNGLEVPAVFGGVSRLEAGDHRFQPLAVVDVGGGDVDDRLHSSLGYRSPADYETALAA
jgi:hypothetical protein